MSFHYSNISEAFLLSTILYCRFRVVAERFGLEQTTAVNFFDKVEEGLRPQRAPTEEELSALGKVAEWVGQEGSRKGGFVGSELQIVQNFVKDGMGSELDMGDEDGEALDFRFLDFQEHQAEQNIYEDASDLIRRELQNAASSQTPKQGYDTLHLNSIYESVFDPLGTAPGLYQQFSAAQGEEVPVYDNAPPGLIEEFDEIQRNIDQMSEDIMKEIAG